MKPVCVFSNFWDVNSIIKNGYFIFSEGAKLYRCRLISEKDKPLNYKVYSIALSHPDCKNLPEIKKCCGDLVRINCLCPTYEILSKYKSDKDWDSYTKEYLKLLRLRKDSVKDWIETLNQDTLYFLCCWENTSGKSKCHRQLLYDAIKKSASIRDKAFFVYRHGDKDEEKENRNIFNLYEIPVGASVNTHSLSQADIQNPFTISVNAGIPVTIGSAEIAEAMGLHNGDPIGAITSFISGNSTIHIQNSEAAQVLEELLGVSPTNATMGTSTFLGVDNEENDLDDFCLGDDEGDIP